MAVLLHADLVQRRWRRCPDDSAALADDVLDLVGVWIIMLNIMGAQRLSLGRRRLCDDGLDDLIEDVQTALAALFEGPGDDVVGQAVAS